jgi:hypothetical protein
MVYVGVDLHRKRSHVVAPDAAVKSCCPGGSATPQPSSCGSSASSSRTRSRSPSRRPTGGAGLLTCDGLAHAGRPGAGGAAHGGPPPRLGWVASVWPLACGSMLRWWPLATALTRCRVPRLCPMTVPAGSKPEDRGGRPPGRVQGAPPADGGGRDRRTPSGSHQGPGRSAPGTRQGASRNGGYSSVTSVNAYPTTRLCQRMTPSTKSNAPRG